LYFGRKEDYFGGKLPFFDRNLPVLERENYQILKNVTLGI